MKLPGTVMSTNTVSTLVRHFFTKQQRVEPRQAMLLAIRVCAPEIKDLQKFYGKYYEKLILNSTFRVYTKSCLSLEFTLKG